MGKGIWAIEMPVASNIEFSSRPRGADRYWGGVKARTEALQPTGRFPRPEGPRSGFLEGFFTPTCQQGGWGARSTVSCPSNLCILALKSGIWWHQMC